MWSKRLHSDVRQNSGELPRVHLRLCRPISNGRHRIGWNARDLPLDPGRLIERDSANHRL